MDLILQAVATVFQPLNFLLVLLGVLIGTLFGAIPGLTATLAIALLSPLTFNMDPVSSMLLLLGIYAGGMYGGSITAITIRAPGAPANAAVVDDGYALTMQGKGGVAIGISNVAGVVGGLLSCLAMIFLAPLLAKFALLFGPAEYFSVTVFGLAAVFAVSGKSFLKGLFSALLGLLLATVGYDPILPFARFTFGQPALTRGLSFLPAVIGMFAFAEVIRLVLEYRGEESLERIKVQRIWPNFQELKSTFYFMIRGGILGILIGILPGAGGTIASYVAYGDVQRKTKHPELIGKGSLEAIAGPESANNAVSGGAMIPMLTLGIPGDSVTAVLLGAMMIQGIQPGPLLFKQHLDVVYPIFAGMILSNFALLLIGMLVVKPISRIAMIKKPLLISFLMIFGVIGSFASSSSLSDVVVAIGFGVLGFFMDRYEFPIAPTVLAMILGPMLENALRQAMITSNGSLMIFITKPISALFLAIAVITSLSMILREKKAARARAAGL
ncbi:MAG: tripartite tricarboxylate transporter permease [Peptococcaceae bacterium]|nr:tripartite tricarboxylate transporter permease [Peptococcaceae bacterium]